MDFKQLLLLKQFCPQKVERPHQHLIHVLEIHLHHKSVLFRIIPEDHVNGKPADTTFNEIFTTFIYNNSSMLLVDFKAGRCLDNREGISCAFYRKDIIGLSSYAQFVDL